ncbi:MAG: TIGR03013 family PEP-CTERM/XrtA system glycosyltransferase [Azoarcus sp.]|jgi:sugar transferase (PEP-CTERM system associated)|nr:TIGR03013 family PEP-CTERM/XrtA system glycosyltransferase [Azoarcus sp.]
MLKAFSQYFSRHVLQRIGLDSLLLIVAVIVSAIFWADNHGVGLKGLLPSALGFVVAVIAANFAFGLYRPVDDDSSYAAFARFVLSALFCLPVAYGTMVFLPWQGFASLALRLQVLVLVLVVLLVRMLINRGQAHSIFAPKILIVGTGEEAQEAERILLQPEHGKTGVQGFFPVSDDAKRLVDAEKVISGSSLTEAVKRLKTDLIIVAIRELRGRALPLRELLDCKLAGVRIIDWLSFHERISRQVRLDSLRASWLIFGEGFQQPLGQMFFKRVFDLAISSCLLVLASPVMLLAALMIVFEDHGPIFYRKERVGLGGQVFNVIRFRCKHIDSNSIDAGGSNNGYAGEESFSGVGRIVYKLRVDRLPQLFNVFRGEMSLVGPRPERPSFVDRLAREIPFYGVRHCVKPGMTGWARVQLKCRNDDNSVSGAIRRLQYDLYYVKNYSLMLDMLVLLETVHVVLMGKRAQ